MKKAAPRSTDLLPTVPPASRVSDRSAWPRLSPRARLLGCVGSLLFVVVVSLGPLVQWADHALHADLDSYTLLIPFISAYLLHLKARSLMRDYFSSPVWAAGFATAGALALATGWHLRGNSGNADLSCAVAAFLCSVAAVAAFFLGREWMRQAAFPLAFLAFMVPLPGQVVGWLENVSKVASAEVAALFFDLSGTPNLHDGVFFRLSDITLEVAPECSGIRSSLVLFITGLLAAHLFLRSYWRQALVAVLVIPLGFLRNGFRIWTIGQLCVYVGPQMINSVIHKHGGPVFFALSLIPLLFVIWWLRRGENSRLLPRSTGLAGD